MIDSHCHLDHEPLLSDLPNVIKRSKDVGIKKLLTISTSLESFSRIKNIIDKDEMIYGTIGIHPHETNDEIISSNNIVKNFKVKKPIFGGYFPVNYEIDCLEVLKRLETKKFNISFPVIKKSNSMEFFKYSFKEPLKINKYGIPEPIKKKN